MKLIGTLVVVGLTCLNSILPGTLAKAQSPTMVIDPRSFGLSSSRFGASAAISGDLIALQQPLDYGVIHLFSVRSNSITRLNTVASPDWAEHARFGWSLGMVGDVLYAGSETTWRAGAHDGTAYLYNNIGMGPNLVSEWTELPNQWAGYFGLCGRLFSDALVVSQGSNPEFGSRAGAFFYRVDSAGNRTSVFSFMAPDTDRDVQGVALSSNRCAVVWYSRANSNDCQVLVFDLDRDANGFSGVTTNVIIPAPNYVAWAGRSTVCDGDLVAVGESRYSIGTNQCGRVRVWRIAAGSSSLIATLTPTDSYNGGNFGESVCLKNNTLLVGSPTVPGISNAQGCVYIYDIPPIGSPTLLKKLQPSAPAIGSGEYFGDPIAWDGSRIIVGSSGSWDRDGSGALYIYDASSLINVGPMPPRAAAGTAALVSGFVVSVSITDGGYGYTNTPLVRFIGGGGSGAQAVAVVSNGVVTAINVLNAGYGYTNAPVVVIEPPFIPSPILGIAPMSFLSFSNLTVGGVYQLQQSVAWYWSNQPVSFTATSTTHTQIVAGVASSGDYRLALSPVSAQAFATAEVYYGFVVNATVASGGSGYVTSPAIAIVGGGGSNAAAMANISGGAVTSITITSAGIGYTNTPTVEIDPPPAAAVSPTAVLPVMRLDSASLAPYDNYQIQFKPVLGGAWGNWNGGLFSPTGVTNSQYLLVTNGAGFFRLQYVP